MDAEVAIRNAQPEESDSVSEVIHAAYAQFAETYPVDFQRYFEMVVKVERHFDNVTNVHAILTVEKLRHKAEATLHVSGGKLYADAVEGNMYAAIDCLIDKLDRQVKKHKEKLTNHHARDARNSRQTQ